MVGDKEQITRPQDIIVYRKNLDNPAYSQSFFRISDSYPLYPLLYYVLLFPTGQMGWHPSICYRQVEDPNDSQRIHVSLEEYFYYCFHIHPSHIESNHLFLAGRLF